MASNSKRIKVTPDILLEYVYDSNNYISEDYNVLTNLKNSTKSFNSTTTLNTVENSLFLVDPLLDKYSIIDTDKFNFLKLQNYSSSVVLYDKIIIYLPSGFDFYDHLGFYLNVYTHGYDNNDKYDLSNYYFTKDNIDSMNVYDLPKPFLYDEKFWVKAIEIQIPSVDYVSKQRLITKAINEPKPNTINKYLTKGEGLSINSLIFFDFSYITSSELILDTPYYYINTPFSFSLPPTPEFTELGVEVLESTQGDYFEIYATYMGSNENMDEFVYSEQIKGNVIQLEYIVTLFEENILTTTQTYQVSENFTNKILYRPVIQFSNTTAAIDIELRVLNLVDNSYQSKFGSLGLTTNLNKYGTKLSRININGNVISPEIYNVKYNNVTSMGIGASDGTDTIMRIPYPMLVDKYKVLAKSLNATNQESGYSPNGTLEIIITSFDTVINFIIAKDVNSSGDPIPYNLSEITNNAKIILTFKSDSEKIEKEILYDADNNYEIGNIYFKVEENDYNVIKQIYNKGYDNFYILIKAATSNTQLYSGKYVFYEDVTFINDNSNGESGVDGVVSDEYSQTDDIIDTYDTTTDNDYGFYNVMVYVRFTENIDQFDTYLETYNIIPKIKYANVFFLERVYGNRIVDIEKLEYLEQVFRIPLNTGSIPYSLNRNNYTTPNIYKTSALPLITKPQTGNGFTTG